MHKSLGMLAFSAVLGFGANANATIAISALPAGQDMPGLLSGYSTDTFDLHPLGTANFNSTALNATFSATPGAGGTPSIVKGSTVNVTAAPWVGGTNGLSTLINFPTKPTPGAGPDPSKYLTIPGGASEAITFNAGKVGTAFGLYWGSVDTFNQIKFLNGTTVIATFNGGQILPFLQATGGQTNFSSNGFIEFTGFAPSGFTEVILGSVPGSTSNAFEVDNIGAKVTNFTAAVPEPSTWAMMVLGFLSVGLIAYRRRGRGDAVRIL